MPEFTRGTDTAVFPEELRGFVTSHGWKASGSDETAGDIAVPAAPAPAVESAPETPAVPTTAAADDNTSGVIND